MGWQPAINLSKKQKWALITVGFLLIYYGAVFISISPRLFDACDDEKIYFYYEQCPRYDILTYGFWVVISFFDRHGGSITALATGAIAAFTLLLWKSTYNLWETTRDQLKLSYDEFIATHRPRIVVTAFDAKMMLDKSVEISFMCINAGDSTALVKGTYWGVGISDRPHRGPERGGGDIFKPIELIPGQQHT